MAPRIPYGEDDWENQKEISSETKIEAAFMSFAAIVFGLLALGLLFAIVKGLWSAGIVNSIVIFGIFAGLFALGRAIYHTILEKDIL